jgi:hypothetical protein
LANQWLRRPPAATIIAFFAALRDVDFAGLWN